MSGLLRPTEQAAAETPGRLNGLFDFSGSQASCADMNPFGPFVRLHAHPLQIGSEDPFCLVIGVAYIIAGHPLFAAY